MGQLTKMATKVQVCKGRIFFKGHAQRKQLARGAVIEGDGKIPISWRGRLLRQPEPGSLQVTKVMRDRLRG